MVNNTTSGVCALRVMTSADLEIVLALRNHQEIRRYMLTQHEISMREHVAWFERASQDPLRELLVFEIDNQCCGFVQFKETCYPGVTDWGFYISPDSPKGSGRKLGIAALSHAFAIEHRHKVCGQALHWNHQSIKFHKSLRFAQEGILRDQYFDGVTYHNMIFFGILKRDWNVEGAMAGMKNDNYR